MAFPDKPGPGAWLQSKNSHLQSDGFRELGGPCKTIPASPFPDPQEADPLKSSISWNGRSLTWKTLLQGQGVCVEGTEKGWIPQACLSHQPPPLHVLHLSYGHSTDIMTFPVQCPMYSVIYLISLFKPVPRQHSQGFGEPEREWWRMEKW